jgi:hypothetical protein
MAEKGAMQRFLACLREKEKKGKEKKWPDSDSLPFSFSPPLAQFSMFLHLRCFAMASLSGTSQVA